MKLTHSRFSRVLTSVAATIALVATGAAAASADEAATFTYDKTIDVSRVPRDMWADPAAHRVYLPSEPGNSGNGSIHWIDTETNKLADESIQLNLPEPQIFRPSEDGTHLYVLHNRQTKLSVVDLTAKTAKESADGLYKLSNGLTVVGDKVYVLSKKGFQVVDPAPATPTVGKEVVVSKAKYPSFKSIVTDAKHSCIWLVESFEQKLYAVDTTNNTVVKDLEVKLSDLVFDGTTPLGGRPALLAIDPELNHLYIVMHPGLKDKTWGEKDKLLVYNTETNKFLGTPIELGNTVRNIKVNSENHEIYLTNAYDNTFTVVSPQTWKISATIDFTELGVTKGKGNVDANVWGIAWDKEHSRVYVSHPYNGDRVSIINRKGADPAVTTLPDAKLGTADTPKNDPWTGPETPKAAKAPADATVVDGASLAWGLNEYVKTWESAPLGTAAKSKDTIFTFTGGKGWVTAKGDADIAFPGGVQIKHYGNSLPDVQTIFGNLHVVIKDGVGTLFADMKWSLSKDKKADSFVTVPMATFYGAKAEVKDGKLVLTLTPDYKGRAYVGEDVTSDDSFPADYINLFPKDMRAWWYSTKASQNAEKVPAPITVTLPKNIKNFTPVAPVALPEITGEFKDVPAGSKLEVTFAKLQPKVTYDVLFHSDPVTLGTVTADDSGNATGTFTVPADAKGAHRLVLAQQGSGYEFASRVVTVGAPVTPQPPSVDPTPAVAEGHLDWGVKTSFRNYIKNGAAQGKWELVDGATGEFRFPAAEAKEFDTKAPAGTYPFKGGVHFTGHHGMLSLNIDNPKVVIDADGNAVLKANVSSRSLTSGQVKDYGEVTVANLADMTTSTTDGKVTVSFAKVTLTKEAVPAFADFYQEGTELDALSMTLKAKADAPVPPAPPVAQPAIKLSLTKVTEGESFEVSVSGLYEGTFDVVLRSDPVVLGKLEVKADGTGSATFTAPVGSAGEHKVEIHSVGDLAQPILSADLTVVAKAVEPTPTKPVEPKPAPTKPVEPKPLPATGVEAGSILALALALTAAGVLMRRRSAVA